MYIFKISRNNSQSILNLSIFRIDFTLKKIYEIFWGEASTRDKSCWVDFWSIYRAATAALVEKQSSEMLELINEARSEYMLQESLYLDEGDGYIQEAPPPPYPSRAPPPQPPALAKYHIYNDPLEFADMDQIAISVSSLAAKFFSAPAFGLSSLANRSSRFRDLYRYRCSHRIQLYTSFRFIIPPPSSSYKIVMP